MTKPRLWGFWTKGKLDMLRDYLPAFTNAAKNKARGVTTYLDLFAGQPGNVDRDTGEPTESSAEIALSTEPPLRHLRFFELEHAESLRAHLVHRFPGRDLDVIPGDCNDTIDLVFGDGRLKPWAPTFAFIDPNGPHFWWTTIEKLAGFRTGRYKTELWMLFPVDMFTRFLTVEVDARAADEETITRVFGTDE